MLQQLLEILEAEAEVRCDPPQLAVGELDPIVVSECHRSFADSKHDMRSPLPQLLKPALEREPNLASLRH